MNSEKAWRTLIDYEEGALSSDDEDGFERRLKDDPALKDELDTVRLLKRGLKAHDWTACPRDPAALTRRILDRVPAPGQARARARARARVVPIFERLHRSLTPALNIGWVGWAAAAACLVLAITFFHQNQIHQQQLARLHTQRQNEKTLFEVAKASLSQSRAHALSKMELSEILLGNSNYNVMDMVEHHGASAVLGAFETLDAPLEPLPVPEGVRVE